MKLKALIIALLLIVPPVYAQRPALVSPVIRFQDNNGKPLAGGKLYSYQAGTTTPLSTYVDSTTGALNTNPVILDSTGSATVFLGNNTYKLVLQNSAGTVQWTADNIAQNAFNQGGGGSTGPAGGDLSGTYPNPRVVKVNGAAVPVSQPYVGTDASGHIVAGSAPASYYQTFQVAGTPLAQEPKMNFISGTGTAITCVDNPGATRTDCTFNLTSSTAVDYYWTEAGCVIGVGQPNHCDFTATLPGAMVSSSYQVYCTLNFLSDTPAAACNLAQATLPTSSGGSITMRIGQYQQNGTTGFTAPTVYMHAHYGTGGGGGGGGGFPITLGSTTIAALSTTGAVTGLSVNGVTLNSSGSTSLFLNQAGGYTSPTGSGTVSSVATTSPLSGGPITTTGTLSCPTCVVASSPGGGIGHFAGSTQTITSSAVNLAGGSSEVTGLLPHANIAATAVTPGSYTNANITVAADGSITGAANGSGGSGTVTTTGSPASGNLSKFSGATSITNADLTGDVTTSGTVATTIANSAVTLAKIANAAANSKLLGSGASGSGAAYVELTLGTNLSMSGTTLNAAGGSGLSGQTTGCLPLAASATTSTSSSLACDNGTTLSYSGTGGITASAGPLTSGAPGGGVGSQVFLTTEGTVPSGLSASGQDNCYADSTAHGILCNFNAGTTRALTVTVASGTSALGTSSISTASCATVVTTSATGVASTDAISWNTNGSLNAVTGYVPSTSGGLTINAYPTANNVNFDVCNWTSGSITPGAVTINWKVVR